MTHPILLRLTARTRANFGKDSLRGLGRLVFIENFKVSRQAKFSGKDPHDRDEERVECTQWQLSHMRNERTQHLSVMLRSKLRENRMQGVVVSVDCKLCGSLFGPGSLCDLGDNTAEELLRGLASESDGDESLGR